MNNGSQGVFMGVFRMDGFLPVVWDCMSLRYQAMKASYTFIYIFLLLILLSMSDSSDSQALVIGKLSFLHTGNAHTQLFWSPRFRTESHDAPVGSTGFV
jgi:hypothetical protein